MKRMVHLVAVLVVVLATLTHVDWAKAAELSFEFYRLESNGTRKLLAEGRKTYELSDVHVEERRSGGVVHWSKSVLLWEDLSVGASIHLEHPLTGFGLWIRKRANGFSWDWFVKKEGTTFEKLQGVGLVTIKSWKEGSSEELISVEFLTDVTLRGKFSHLPFMGLPDEDTHHLVVKKGSVLLLGKEG